MRKFMVIAALAIITTGCAVGPDYKAPKQALPEQWPDQELLSDEEQQDWKDWWTRYDDPVLTQLVERALDDNLSLQLQADRIREARAQLGLSRANRWPSLNAQANAAREQQPGAFMPAGGPTGAQNQFSVSGILSYELDIWGRLGRQKEMADALLTQSVYGTDAIRLNLIADVVTTYFNLRSAQQQLDLTEQTLDSRRQTLELTNLRYQSGAIDPLGVRQARASLESTRALVPSLRQQVHMTHSALAVLVGYTPEELFGELDFGDSQLTDIHLPDSVPSVLPSELLRRRPDIRAAEAGLMASTAQVGATIADVLPRLNLSALAGSAALETGNLFSQATEVWNLGANMSAPILGFGRNRAHIAAAKARRDQAQTQYQIVVTTAFHEVRDALTLYNSSNERVQAVQRQTDAISETLELAELQYQEGAIGFYELLDAQRGLLDAQLALSDALRDRLAATTTLFKAMGGGWNPDKEPRT